MSEDEGDAGDESSEEVAVADVESLRERLDAISEALDAAETEPELDEVEADIEALEEDLEAAELPEPDDEDEEDPAEALESDLSEARDDLEEQRGPYGEDIVANVEEARSTVADTRWTEDGEPDVLDAVNDFLGMDLLDVSGGADSIEDAETFLEDAAATVEAMALDADDDAEDIASLLEASETLLAGLEDAEEWDDLSQREMLDYHGFYDVVDHRKDFPPEWNAIKTFERDMDAEKILIGLDMFESDFMERHCLESLENFGPEEALDPMLQRAQRRDKKAISILGKIGSDEPVETLVEYVDADSDKELQKVTFRALGEIGSEEATQAIADKLVAEDAMTRSRAARSLGLIGDTRAVEPLADVLENDEDDTVRSSAAWALNRIGTEAALDAVAEYTDDRSFLVQEEAKKAV
ncbi:HEAT repeat domain-containing protein [Haloarchaeobius iranensis]|uniref:HEAT repeat-containing protein n=1 Tax=Haloarchaeobius iranensis TaxID=996166 RepID=A0A1G9WHP3_9EURY|nr:HEAT repeat domain-containing protein [Haloarchaeobius iranensis]SDM84092.1 HEAT repeat-containing protein [Haloarchaeobius iranensis]